MLAAGRRVTGSDGGHVLRVEEVERLLPDDHADLFERLNDHRELRHSVSYHAGIVSEAESEATLRDARELLDAAEAYSAPDQ